MIDQLKYEVSCWKTKSVVVIAMQFDGTRESLDDVENFVGHPCGYEYSDQEYRVWVNSRKPDGGSYASAGDWVVKKRDGSLVTYTPNTFMEWLVRAAVNRTTPDLKGRNAPQERDMKGG